MARLPAIVNALVEVDGRDRAFIEHSARIVREAGYISTTKRGAGASSVSCAEVVNLLLALNGASSPKDGPHAINRLRPLECTVFNTLDTPVFSAVAGCASFGDALEHLIHFFPLLVQNYDQHLGTYGGWKSVISSDTFPRSIEMLVSIEANYCSIEIGYNGGGDLDCGYGSGRSLSSTEPQLGRNTSVRLSGRMFQRIWQVLNNQISPC